MKVYTDRLGIRYGCWFVGNPVFAANALGIRTIILIPASTRVTRPATT